jgi:hypothetical protein
MTAEEHLAKAEEFSEYHGSADQTQAHALIAIAKFLQRLAPSTIAELPPGPDRIVTRR